MDRWFLHPLIGARPGPLARTLWRHRGTSRLGVVLVALVLGAVRWPNCLVEAARTRDPASMDFDPPPVFIVGHWRSGTTLLHQILSRDPSFCFPRLIDVLSPYEFFPSPLEKFTHPVIFRLLPPTRPMDDVPLHPDFPQEEEMALAAMAAPSFFNCIYFPASFETIFRTEVLLQSEHGSSLVEDWTAAYSYYLRKLVLRYPGKGLLLKNPANSARIPLLLKLFPGAKFIHIHRNPFDVFSSMSKLYHHMFPLLALQKYDVRKISEYVLRSYPLLMRPLLEACATLPPTQLGTVSYSELTADPVTLVASIYRRLELPLEAETVAEMAEFLARTPILAAPPARLPEGLAETVYEAWQPLFERLGYDREQPRESPPMSYSV